MSHNWGREEKEERRGEKGRSRISFGMSLPGGGAYFECLVPGAGDGTAVVGGLNPMDTLDWSRMLCVCVCV